MGISIVQSNFAQNHFGTTGTSGTATVTGSAVTSGNGVLLGFGGNDGIVTKTVGTVQDNQGNTYAQIFFDNTASNGMGWYYKTNITNGPTTFNAPWTSGTAANPNVLMAMYELSGLNASPVDVGVLLQPAGSTSFNSGFTTASGNEMGFAMLNNAFGSNQTSVTMTNGWTLETGLGSSLGSPYYTVYAHVALSAAGANSIQGSTTASDLWFICLCTLTQTSASASPATGSESLGSSPSRINYGITPLVAKERGIYMPTRKIILPPWHRKQPVTQPTLHG